MGRTKRRIELRVLQVVRIYRSMMACSADKRDYTNPSLLDVWNALKRIENNTNSLIKDIKDLQNNYNEL